MRIRRAILSVSDKRGIVDLARALHAAQVELVASGGTAQTLVEAGLPVVPVEKITGNPEAFQGRMKTLSFQICSGILFRRGDENDQREMKELKIPAVDCVVVNFYPFEKDPSVEQIDIGGPTLVRAAAKNYPDVLVLTDPEQYSVIIDELKQSGQVNHETADGCAKRAWDRVEAYDSAIARHMGGANRLQLRYGENPHQMAFLDFDPTGPVDWARPLTETALSYNNLLDFTAAYDLVSELVRRDSSQHAVVIIKHNNPCGVAVCPDQLTALKLAWEGDPISAFGGVLAFSHALEDRAAAWLSEKFVEMVGAPQLTKDASALQILGAKRKKLKAVCVRRYGEMPAETLVRIPGGRLCQTADQIAESQESLKLVTQKKFPEDSEGLIRFGIAVARVLKSNTIALVRKRSEGFQLVGAGQGQPNRVEALKALAVPRAHGVLQATAASMGELCMISDAFFPFRDTVDEAFRAGIRYIVQPGGSIKDQECIDACDEHGIAMIMTGVRHFKH